MTTKSLHHTLFNWAVPYRIVRPLGWTERERDREFCMTVPYLLPPGCQTGKCDWCCWSSCSSPLQSWPPGRTYEQRSSPQRDASLSSHALSQVVHSAFPPRTLSGQWCGLAFWNFYFGSIPTHRGYRSCVLFVRQTNVFSMPAGEKVKLPFGPFSKYNSGYHTLRQSTGTVMKHPSAPF